MKLFTSKMLERLMSEQKKKSEGLLPEIIKRLIRSSCPDYSYLRAPEEDDIWAPGYDGIVDNGTKRLMWHRELACGNLEPMRIPWKKSTAIMENAQPVRLE